MKKFLSLACLALLCGCGEEKVTLHIFNWSDYIDESLIAKFEQENDCKIVQDVFDDNETMLAKLLAGASGYDIVFPSSYIIPVMVRNDLIQPLNMDLLPNVKENFDEKYLSLKHEYMMKYSVPYAFSMTGIAYRKDKVSDQEKIDSWDALKHPAFEGRVSLLHDIREMMGVGLKMTGHSVNSKDPKEIDEALNYILGLKRHARKLDNLMYKSALVNGEFFISLGYNSDVLQIMQENPAVDLKFFIPKEGSTCCWDEMVITNNAKTELAHKFINFLYDAEHAAINMPYVAAIMPNKGMWKYLDSEISKNELYYPNAETLQRLELIMDLGDKISLYNKAWDVFTTKRME